MYAGAAILGDGAAQQGAAAYRDHLAAGARAWLAEALPGGAPIGFALITKPDLAAAAEGDIELKRIYSLSRFHGPGLGAAMLERAVSAAEGHRHLLLGLPSRNDQDQTRVASGKESQSV